MKRYLAWVGGNLDGFIGLVLAVGVAVMGLLNVVPSELVNSAILLILAVMAEAVLRDRYRRGQSDREIRAALVAATGALHQLPARLDSLARVEQVMAESRAALAKLSMVRVLSGNEVRQALAEARQRTDRWLFKGGTGTYIRAVTLPECVENARQRRGRLTVQLEIIDPTDEAVCDRYAKFRRALSADRPDGIGERWTPDRTRKEAFATVLAACWYRQQFGLLEIDVRLSSVMTTFRWDLSADRMIITQEDPGAPALMIEEGTFFYERWSTELIATLEQARQVPLDAARRVTLSEEPTVEQTRRLFDALSLPLPRAFSDRDVVDIVQKAIDPRNPYQ